MTDAVQQSLINAIPTIIGSLAAAWVVVRRVNKKTDEKANETNQIVESRTAETRQKIDDVHVMVNGNLSAERARADNAEVKVGIVEAKHDALAQENVALREQLSRAHKRATDA